MMQIGKILETDVLIIGGGGAALRAAVAAYDAGARTTVVLKGEPGRSGATISPDSKGVAWQAADDCAGEADSPDVHLHNILDVGLGMTDPRLARILAYEILDRTEELERWGMRFIPDPAGRKPHYTGYSCFGDQPRAHGIANSGYGHAGDIVRVLLEQLRRRKVEVQSNIFVIDLLIHDGACYGALALGPEGEVIEYHAGAVVVVAGGARQIFPLEPGRTRIDTTGDGYAMALRAGAVLTNMEFMQYMLHPVQPFPVSVPGSFWMSMPVIRNRRGDDALALYLPAGVDREQAFMERTLHYPFSSRDHSKWLDIAFASEIRANRGTPDGGLYLDFAKVKPGGFIFSRPQHLPEDYHRPVELPDGWVQMRPAAHAINGGILIDERAQSSIPGLFAAGEVAAGPHGADRLGGGMVTNSQVFGERAGRYAAEYALAAAMHVSASPEMERPLARLQQFGKGNHDAEQILTELQAATARWLMVTKHEQGLQQLLDRIQELGAMHLPRVRADNTALLRRALEVDNSLVTAELMTRAALVRRESRGSHFREDFPQQDDARWNKSILFRMESGSLDVEYRSLCG